MARAKTAVMIIATPASSLTFFPSGRPQSRKPQLMNNVGRSIRSRVRGLHRLLPNLNRLLPHVRWPQDSRTLEGDAKRQQTTSADESGDGG
jgi:hypothetical protein